MTTANTLPPVQPPQQAAVQDSWKTPRRMSGIRAFSGSSTEERDLCEDAPVCWICLDGTRPECGLMQPCKCPRFAHARCLARWQLQSAGSRKETHCEFCDAQLPDWKRTLTPQCGATAPAVMNVNFDGRTYSFEVKPGADGYRQFTEAIRRAFSLPEDSELNITFTCDEPCTAGLLHSGALLTLQGAGAYDAAVHCASVSAARRNLQQRAHEGASPGTSGASSLGSSGAYRGHYEGSGSTPGASPHANSPASSTGASGSSGAVGGGEGGVSGGGPKTRRLGSLGRKLRSAICDFLTINPKP